MGTPHQGGSGVHLVERYDENDGKVAFFFMYLGGGDDLLYTKTSYYI